MSLAPFVHGSKAIRRLPKDNWWRVEFTMGYYSGMDMFAAQKPFMDHFSVWAYRNGISEYQMHGLYGFIYFKTESDAMLCYLAFV